MKCKKYKIYINQLYNDLKKSNTFLDKYKQSINLDIVLEGGGFSGAYEVGVLLFIKKLENKSIVKINRISGVSIGSIIGLLYVINKLHYYEKYYNKLREDWYLNLELKTLSEIIKDIVFSISDETFTDIQNDKLFISYYNLKSKQHITKSSYVNKNDLYETIMKSTHMPLIKSKTFTYKDSTNTQFIDGLYPYIFTNKYDNDQNHKILYVSINQIHKLHTCIDTYNETDCFSRVLHGILYCYDLFKYNKKNDYCSFLDEWNLIDITYYRIKQLVLLLFMYIIYFLNNIFNYFKPFIERTPIINSVWTIYGCYYDDLLRFFFHK